MDDIKGQEPRGTFPGAIVGGAFLLVVGGTMFLDQRGWGDLSFRHVIGPACLIILGMLMLVGHHSPMQLRKRGGLTGGLWLIGVGCWMLISQLHVFGLDYGTSWPLLVILSGTIMLVRGLR